MGLRWTRSAACVRGAQRAFATSTAARGAVQLDYEVHEPPSSDRDVAKHTKGIVVCHGL